MADTAAFPLKKFEEAIDAVSKFRERGEQKFDAMQSQLDGIDLRVKSGDFYRGSTRKSLADTLKDNESFARLMTDRKGRAVITLKGEDTRLMERKTTITSGAVGYMGPGVLGIDRIPGITAEARQTLTMRDVLYATPTDQPLIEFVKVVNPMAVASPAPEGTLKAENAVTFSAAAERVRTIATWIPASRQILDDWKELANFLNSTLSYYVDLAEEQQILTGDSTGENLHGLIPQASNFNAGLLSASAGWNKIDMVGRAIQQIEEAKEISPSFIVVHPRDWWSMRLQKDGFGRYILGDPQEVVVRNLFNRTIVTTTSIASGTFLVGSGDPAASQLRDRMETVVDISTEDGTNFRQNLVTTRAEKRVALVVERPGSYVTGSFTTSPAGM